MKNYYVYIMANSTCTLYTGITNNILRRTHQHKSHQCKGFTDKYNINRLVYVEAFSDPLSAITREKQIKKWNRGKKINLIESINPDWKDLSE
ncbi:MAG: GIY-YIG nuclease family protein [Phycisphaerales bacterium]